MSDNKEFGCLMLILVGGLIAIIPLSIFLDSIACKSRWSDYENKYSIMGGCQVNIDGKWTPEDRVREFAA
jgi:hypothetical protein